MSALDALLREPGAAAILAALNGGEPGMRAAETRIIGGAVRNVLIGEPVSDVDFATTLAPEEVTARVKAAGLKAVPTGLAHGTVTVVVGKRGHEVTTLRRDVETDGRHAVVAFTDSFEEDALRRDFTINQLSLSTDGALHDYAGGLDDLKARRVRFIGDPERRIREDYLRILRFFRFSARYGEGPFDEEGLSACAALAEGMAILSRERVWAELAKLLVAPRASEALRAMREAGVWSRMLDLPADLAAFDAALAVAPHADAVSRLAALCLREAADVGRLDEALRLSVAERRRLEAAAGARAELGAATLNEQAWRGAAFRHGAAGARDGGLTLGPLLPPEARDWMALPAPVSPFRGADALKLGVPAGPAVGRALALAEREWEEAGFPDDAEAAAAMLGRAAKAAV